MQCDMLDVNVPSVFTYQPASQELQSTTFSVHQCIKSPFHFLPDDEKGNHNILSPRSFRIDNTPIILKEYDFWPYSLASDRATVCPLMR
jgi:hypothetical protein